MVNPVQSVSAAQNEAEAGVRRNPAPPQASLPQDKVTISPQAHAQLQAQAHVKQAVSAGDKK
jgi:hypothetical protein